MSKGPATFRQADLSRAVKAMRAAGVDVARLRVTIDKTGTIEITVRGGEGGNGDAAAPNEWDEVYNGNDQAPVRQ
jgi:hypothetical protein